MSSSTIDRLFHGPAFEKNAIFNFRTPNDAARQHVKNVYTTLASAVCAATLGTLVHLRVHIGGPFLALGGLALLLWLGATPDTPSNMQKRMALFLGFAVTQGLSIGPLVEYVLIVNPATLVTALVATGLVFGAFTLSALWAQDRRYLLLGGFLGSALSVFFWLGLVGLFVRSSMLYNLQLYGGLVVFSLYVLFDTQMILHKAELGSRDHIWHAVELFIDLVAIFVRILIILLKNRESSKDGRSKNRR